MLLPLLLFNQSKAHARGPIAALGSQSNSSQSSPGEGRHYPQLRSSAPESWAETNWKEPTLSGLLVLWTLKRFRKLGEFHRKWCLGRTGNKRKAAFAVLLWAGMGSACLPGFYLKFPSTPGTLCRMCACRNQQKSKTCNTSKLWWYLQENSHSSRAFFAKLYFN